MAADPAGLRPGPGGHRRGACADDTAAAAPARPAPDRDPLQPGDPGNPDERLRVPEDEVPDRVRRLLPRSGHQARPDGQRGRHLPVVFACPAHQRLLEHRCPGCGHAVRAGSGDRASPALLPVMRLGGLHPAQCRAVLVPGGRSRWTLPRCCGARLDQTRPRRHASPGLLALQDKILRLLDPDGPANSVSAGMLASPASYFADLRALGLLAYSTWPEARHLSPSSEIAAAIDQHVASFRQQEAERQANSPESVARTTPPPLDAAVSARPGAHRGQHP